jgi:hypothetical protein
MLYNDEETRKDEELFQEHLKKARSLTKEDMDKLMLHMGTLAQAALKLKAQPSLTEEEAALLQRIKTMLQETTKNITDAKLVIGESTKRQAYAYYQHIKKLAEEGNTDAIKVYEQLKPDYQASLRSDMGDN